MVLITGATGAIGPRVIHALHQAGYQISAFSVDAPASGMFPSDVNVVIGDVTDRAAVQSAMRGPDMGDVHQNISYLPISALT
ncbi:MAG: NAD-dependent epimerase/dehydratase family protein [Methanosarcinales archaeon]|nr:MAG: NAD-dependent epimerase/dehydratase family protein [Methanosarcinales archaeon]